MQGYEVQSNEVRLQKVRVREGQFLLAKFPETGIQMKIKWSNFEKEVAKHKEQQQRTSKLFESVELVSRVLPLRVRREAFEPTYHELKGDHMKPVRKYER